MLWIFLLQEKCHQYWPTERSARYQYFVVDPMAEYNMPQYILREFKVTDARVGFLCQLCIQRCSDIMIIRRFHSIHNLVDCGVLQAMWPWEELTYGQSWTPRSTHYLLTTPT